MRTRIAVTAAAVLTAASIAFAADTSTGSSGQQARQSNQSQQHSQSADRYSSNSSSDKSSAANGQNAPEGWVLLDERVVYLMAKEPQAHLLQAHLEMNKDPKAAASECRIAADYLDMQSSQAAKQGHDKSQLHQAASDLRHFADRIDDKSAKQEDATKLFGRVNYDLARAYNDEAKAALDQNKLVRAGHDLESAAESFRQCMVWSNQQPQQQAAAAIDKAAQIATALYMAPHAQANEAQTAGNRQSGNSYNSSSNANSSPSNNTSSGNNNANAPSALSSSSDLKQQAQQACQDLSRQIDQCKDQFKSGAKSSNSNSSNNSSGAQKS